MNRTKQSPCGSCTRVKNPGDCENKCCRVWGKWFLERWGAIHGYYQRYGKKEENNELEKRGH